jgi:hypothetical protein
VAGARQPGHRLAPLAVGAKPLAVSADDDTRDDPLERLADPPRVEAMVLAAAISTDCVAELPVGAAASCGVRCHGAIVAGARSP